MEADVRLHSASTNPQRDYDPFLRPAPVSAFVGLGLWAIAIGLAFRAQYLLTPLRQLEDGRLLYGVAAAFALAGVLLIERSAPVVGPSDDPLPLEVWHWTSPHRVAAAGLIALGVLGSLSTIYLLAVRKAPDVALWVWLLSLMLVPLGAALGARNPIRLSRQHIVGVPSAETLAVLGILVLALWLRLPNLEAVPPDVHGDEAAVGLEARRILRGEVPNLFWAGWYHIPYLSFAIQALPMRIFGDNLFGLRIGSVVQGVLSVLLLYLLTRRLFGTRPALTAAFLLAVSQWHVHFSRDGINYLQALVATLLLFYFMVRALDTRRPLDFVLAGFAIGLCFVVYYPARLAPVLAGLYLLRRASTNPDFLGRHWPGLCATVVGAVVFLAPMAVLFTMAPETLTSRTTGVLVFTPANLQHEFASYHVTRVEEVLLIQAQHTLEAFNIRGESSLQYGRRGPLLDYWTSALLVLGVPFVTLRLFRPSYLLVASWFWLTLILGAMLTTDAPFSPRIIIVIPALMIVVGLVIDAGWRGANQVFGQVGRYSFGGLVVIFLGLALVANYRDYFETHVVIDRPASWPTAIARFVRQVNDEYRVYVIGGTNTGLKHETVRFLAPTVDGIDVRNQSLELPLDRIPAKKGVAFIVMPDAPDHNDRVEAIKRAYPKGREQVYTTPRGLPLFTSYLVEPAELLAANPSATRE